MYFAEIIGSAKNKNEIIFRASVLMTSGPLTRGACQGFYVIRTKQGHAGNSSISGIFNRVECPMRI